MLIRVLELFRLYKDVDSRVEPIARLALLCLCLDDHVTVIFVQCIILRTHHADEIFFAATTFVNRHVLLGIQMVKCVVSEVRTPLVFHSELLEFRLFKPLKPFCFELFRKEAYEACLLRFGKAL